MDVAAYHQLLLRIAGWTSDDLLAAARTLLASQRGLEVAETLVFAAVSGRIAMLSEDVDLLAQTLAREGHVGRVAAGIRTVARLGLPCVTWAPGQEGVADAVDAAAVDAIHQHSDGTALGVWRAWRAPSLPTVWPPPRRVYLIQAATVPDRLPLLAARGQELLEHAGDGAPQVEVFADGAQLPPYQRAALANATLLWSRGGTTPLAVARVFDPVLSAGGPGFAVGHPRLEDAERRRVLSYLDGGTRVLSSTALMDDVIDVAQHARVPTGFRTDGTWVWCDASAYYLGRHAIAPDQALLNHIRAAGPVPDPVDAVGIHRAIAALRPRSVGADDILAWAGRETDAR